MQWVNSARITVFLAVSLSVPVRREATCVGACHGGTDVTIDSLLTMVNIALGSSSLSACTAGDANGDGEITINEILAAVNNALNGCSVPPDANFKPDPRCGSDRGWFGNRTTGWHGHDSGDNSVRGLANRRDRE